MANSSPNEKPQRAGPWTDDEKLKLIFQLVFQLPKIDWKQVTVPEGRDLKSCQNMIDGEKRRLGIARGPNGPKAKDAGEKAASKDNGTPKTESSAANSPLNVVETNGEDADTETPAKKKKVATPRKRKSSTNNEAEGDKDTNGAANGEEKPKKKRAPAKPKVKKEAANTNADQKVPEVKSPQSKYGAMLEQFSSPHTPGTGHDNNDEDEGDSINKIVPAPEHA